MQLICSSCDKPKAKLECGLCHCALCKSCTQFVEEGFFSFLAVVPEDLTHTAFCMTCYQTKVVNEIEAYEADMEKAKDIIVFEKDQGKETRGIKRLEDPLVVTDCLDSKEVMMKIAFRAFKAGFNGIVSFEANATRERNGSYHKVTWRGSAIPAHIDVSKLPKDKSLWHNPN